MLAPSSALSWWTGGFAIIYNRAKIVLYEIGVLYFVELLVDHSKIIVVVGVSCLGFLLDFESLQVGYHGLGNVIGDIVVIDPCLIWLRVVDHSYIFKYILH